VAPTDEIADGVQTAEGFGRVKSSLPEEIDLSFSAQIARLEQENIRLSADAEEVKMQLSVESQRREKVEATMEQLGVVNQRLQEQYDKASLAAESYVRVLQRQCQGLSAVMPVLEGLKQDLSNKASNAEHWHKICSSSG
jgi:hypothetical protein